MAFPVLNWFELDWEDQTEGPAVYHTRFAHIGRPLGARKLGYHAEILPPGTALCPYHAHLVNEEMFLVLGGKMSVRLDCEEYPLAAGDLVAVPPGPDGAHQLLNRNDRPAHLLAASTMIQREVVDYPDSGKRIFGVAGLATAAAGGKASVEVSEADGAALPQDSARLIVRDGRAVDYFEGEPPGEGLGEPPPAPEVRDRRIVNLDEVPWERFFESGLFGGERKRLGRQAGARLLGYRLYRLQPGDRSFPFHLHHVNEEFFYVRSGYGELRTREGVLDLKPGDAFACPPGPEGAHAIRNPGDRPLEYLALSTMEHPEVAEFPDSGKLYVFVGSAPGADPAGRAVDLVFRRGDAVDYLEGEV